MSKADYSIASAEERESVITLLQRNANQMIEQRKVRDPQKLREAVDQFCRRIRNGEVITGKDYQQLVSLFQKKLNV